MATSIFVCEQASWCCVVSASEFATRFDSLSDFVKRITGRVLIPIQENDSLSVYVAWQQKFAFSLSTIQQDDVFFCFVTAVSPKEVLHLLERQLRSIFGSLLYKSPQGFPFSQHLGQLRIREFGKNPMSSAVYHAQQELYGVLSKDFAGVGSTVSDRSLFDKAPHKTISFDCYVTSNAAFFFSYEVKPDPDTGKSQYLWFFSLLSREKFSAAFRQQLLRITEEQFISQAQPERVCYKGTGFMES